MQYLAALFFVLLGFGFLGGIDHIIGTLIGLSLLIGGFLYVMPWQAVLVYLHLVPVRGEDTMADEWGEFWACIRWGVVYAALIIGGNYIYNKYYPASAYDHMLINESSGLTREEITQDYERWKAKQEEPKP